MFTTERLILRPYEESDDADFLKLWNDAEVQETSQYSYVVPTSSAAIRGRKESRENALLCVVLIIAESGTFLGQCTLHMDTPKNRDARLGISIVKEHWNKGYGTETLRWLTKYAFHSLGLHRISLDVAEGNKGGIRAYQNV